MKLWSLSVCLPPLLSPGACVCVCLCVCVSVCVQSPLICFLSVYPIVSAIFVRAGFLIWSPEHVRRHDGRGHQHAAEAAGYVHYPGGHPHHPLRHAGPVRPRDGRSRVAQHLPPRLRKRLLLPIPK